MKGKEIYANVDFYSASVYHMMGIPRDLFTPVFAISRMSGLPGISSKKSMQRRNPSLNSTGRTPIMSAPIADRRPVNIFPSGGGRPDFTADDRIDDTGA